MSKAKPKPPVVPEHFNHHLGYIRTWIDGFEAAGKTGPHAKDTLRQVQQFLLELKKG